MRLPPLTPQRKKELLILAGAGAAAVALLILRGRSAAGSASSTGSVGPLFDPSSLLGSGGFDPSSGLPLGDSTGTDSLGNDPTAADVIGNDVAAAISQWLASTPVTDPGLSGAASSVVTPTTPFQYDTGPVTIKVTPVSSAPPAPAGGNDTGGQATKAPTSRVGTPTPPPPSAAKVDKAPSFTAEAPKTQQLAVTAAKNNQVLTKGRQLQ